MCDEHTIKDEQDQPSILTRREFNTLAAGASVAFSFPALANPLKTVSQDVDIPTADGVCDALFVHPAEGTHPAVLIWPDILALRPSFRAMATRLAESGYAVLCINPYYRDARSPVVETGESFRDDATRKKIYPLYQSLSPQTHTCGMRVPLSIGLISNLLSIKIAPSALWVIAWVAPWLCARLPRGQIE